ncbi:MAG: ASKHA domain-containing protein [Promethearchaeota archaeon]
MTKTEITFQPDGKRVSIDVGETIMDGAKRGGIDIQSICGGTAICGKCKVLINPGQDLVNPITDDEKRLLTQLEIQKSYRLACCVIPQGNIYVEIPPSSRIGKQRLQVEGIEVPVEFEPLIQKLGLKIAPPSLQDLRSDGERILDEVRKIFDYDIKFDNNVIHRIPHILRNGNWVVTVTIWNNQKIIDIEPNMTFENNYGVALDIGTTKIAAYLVNLYDGSLLASDSMMNPQIPYGEDVISRITLTKEFALLSNLVVDVINQLIESLCEKADIKLNWIYEVSIVGNTAMHHLFLRIPPEYLAVAPYVPVIRQPLNIPAEKLALNIFPYGNAYVFPIIAGFVGGDKVAEILATEIYKSDEICLTLDIGTNTEIALGNKEDILVCSCASGPAFEGAYIRHGMRAATGAIERIKIDPETFEVTYKTIDNEKPRGICGSAIVDVLSEMFKAEIIDHRGRINTSLSNTRIVDTKDGAKFIIAWQEDTVLEEDLFITQEDLKQLQLAKAAMHTGAAILLKNKGMKKEDIAHVFIAGAFGSYVDPEAAVNIGMIPDVPIEIIKSVGNAAGTGARLALLSKRSRENAEEIARKVRYLELVLDPDFTREYAKSMYIPHKDRISPRK